MTGADIEALVAAFLDARDTDPTLTPESFSSGHPGAGARLLAAIRTAIEVESMFPAETTAPRTIGPYRVIEEIGRGGMGIVYRVEREDRAYALKLLPLAPFVGPRMLERFRREAETLRQISHPNIVAVRDTGLHGEVPYLVMDLVEGRSLAGTTPGMTPDAAARLVAVLCGAVDAAHRAGVLHRDLKPQNVVVRPDGQPVLLDFGLSVAEEFPTLTGTGEILGTPRYMAPEQAAGGRIDERTDVHALGLILYELAAGCPARPTEVRETLMRSVRLGLIRSPRQAAPAIPRSLERIIMTALARDPDRRYQSAAAMAEDLERHLRGDAVAARPPGRLARVWDRAAALPVRRSVLAAGAAVLIALVAASVWALSRPGAVVTPEEARAAARQLDRSVAFYLDGKRDSAAIAVAAARRHDRRNRTARVLEAHLGGGGNESARAGNSTYARALLAALQRYKANDPAGARVALASCGEEGSDASLVLAVRGICAEREGDHAAAEADLTAALRVLPSSVTMHRRLARVYERANRLEDAERLYRRCTELTPDSAAVWRDLARLHLNRRDLAAGYAAVERAIALASDGHGGGRDVATLRILVGLHIHSGRGEEARATLHEILRNEPDDVSSWHQLGYSFDMDHRIVEAVDAYNRVLALDPHHTGTLLNLANLHVGASRGQCRGCDEAYRAHPSYLDQAKAEGYLLRCLRENRGEAEWITHSARDVALRLHDRRAVMDLLVELTEGQEKTPAVLRLEDLLRRLRLVEGG